MVKNLHNHIKIILPVLLCITFTWCFGCAFFTGRYGRLMINDDVRARFETFNVGSYVYYTSGTDLYSRAIIGIDIEEPFEQGLWKKRLFTADTLEEFVRNMQYKASSVGLRLYGFDIKDNEEKKVGIWYSVQDVTPSISRNEEGNLIISTPPLDVYERAPRWKTFSY